MEPDSRLRLLSLLKLAYSGERAAAYAYRGHWKSARDPEERARIAQIEEDEWHHRRLVGEMIRGLDGAPNAAQELRALLIGRVLGFLCHFSGWFLPMYGAGRLESHNVREYEDAARYARACGRDDLIDCLLTMAEVEWDHERYFRGKVEPHPWTRFIPLWPAPPPRETIRDAGERGA